MNQMEATTSGSLVSPEYEDYGGSEINDMLGSIMAPVGVQEMMNSLLGTEVQVNNVPYNQQAETSYYQNHSYFDHQAEEIVKLKDEIQFWKKETNFWQYEGNCYSKEKDMWKNEAIMLKADVEKLKAETAGWKAEAGKWKGQAHNGQMEYCTLLKQNANLWNFWKASEDAKVANSHKFQNVFQKLNSNREQLEKNIENQKKELLYEKESRELLQAELVALKATMEEMGNHQKMIVTTLRNKACAKAKELQDKLESQTMEYENFTLGVNGRVSELEGKVQSLQNEVAQRESVIGGFNNYCGQIYEAKRQAEIESRKLKDFMVSLTCDLQVNMGKFMKKYGLTVTPVLDSKWDWRTKEEKDLVSHLRMLVTLTEGTYQEWQENGMLKRKQSDETAGNAVGTGTGDKKTGMDDEKPGCSYDASAAGKPSSSKKWKF